MILWRVRGHNHGESHLLLSSPLNTAQFLMWGKYIWIIFVILVQQENTRNWTQVQTLKAELLQLSNIYSKSKGLQGAGKIKQAKSRKRSKNTEKWQTEEEAQIKRPRPHKQFDFFYFWVGRVFQFFHFFKFLMFFNLKWTEVELCHEQQKANVFEQTMPKINK